MIDETKQIKEMSKYIQFYGECNVGKRCCEFGAEEIALDLYDEGYRKQSETAKEILDLLGNGYNGHTGKYFWEMEWYKSFYVEVCRIYGIEEGLKDK